MKIQHLNESIKSLPSDELQTLLETDYSEAYEHAKDGHYIFKGMYMSLDPATAHLLEPLKGRKSKNTLNYYTLWMNNSQEWADYPKRSVICTNSSRNAGDYGFQTFIILPKNGTKMGVCDDFDLWSSFDFGGGMADASDVNYFFNAMFEKFYKKPPETYEDMVDMLKGIKVNDETFNYVSSAMSRQGLNKSKLLNIFKEHGAYGLFASLFSTKGFEMTTVGGVYQYNDKAREVWFDNQFIAIDIERKEDINPMKISETQYKFNDEMLGSHSGQTDMKISLEHNGDVVAHLVYTVYQGVPAISMIEVKEKRKSYGSALVKKLQSLYPDEEIEWGMTTDEGEKLRKSFDYKKVPTEHYDDFVRYKEVKKELDKYQERANELWSKDTLSNEEKKELKSIGEKLNDLNDEVYDLEDIIDFEKPYKKIIQ